MASRDRRRTPARADLAAEKLRGLVDAPRFVAPRRMRVIANVVDLRPAPDLQSGIDTQLVRGERFDVYDIAGQWAWGQAERDDYCGYLDAGALAADAAAPTHSVNVRATFVYAQPDMKTPRRAVLPFGAQVCVTRMEQQFAEIEDGFVFAAHLACADARAGDYVAIAERFMGTPYLWGGKSAFGIDCSGLVQTALHAAGCAAPRDTDMQEAELGVNLGVNLGLNFGANASDTDLGALRRGDLVYWKGHVGIMQDATRLLHANAFHMLVASEPLTEAIRRIMAGGGAAPRAFKRIAQSA